MHPKRAMAFLSAGALAAVIAHLAFSALVALWANGMLQHRLVNVRHLGYRPELWKSLMADFLREMERDPRPKITIVGSSFSWGYSWQEDTTYPAKVQKLLPKYKVTNASVVGGSLVSTSIVLCASLNAGVRHDVLVLEYSLPNNVNDKLGDFPGCPEKVYHQLGIPYLSFLLENPFGFGSFRVFFDEFNYFQAERKFAKVKLPDDYLPKRQEFDREIEQLTQYLIGVVALGRDISDKIVLFPAPIFRDGVDHFQMMPDDIDYANKRLFEVCRSIQGVICLAPPNFERKYYGNLTHLNKAGHIAFADWLVNELDLK